MSVLPHMCYKYSGRFTCAKHWAVWHMPWSIEGHIYLYVPKHIRVHIEIKKNPPALPTKTYTTLVPKREKQPLFADSGRKKTRPFFNRNRWFWGPIKHPFLKQNAISFSSYKIKYPICDSEINCIKHKASLLCTSYFALRLIWNEYLNTRPMCNVWKPGWKQTDTCKMLTLFKISPIYACKIPLFVDFANSRQPLKKYRFSRESGYERGIHFVREWGSRDITQLVYVMEHSWKNMSIPWYPGFLSHQAISRHVILWLLFN